MLNVPDYGSTILFAPLEVRGLSLKNRFVMAPMTRSFAVEGIPTDDMARYYQRRAQGGVGLIISEGTGVERLGARNDPGVPRLSEAARVGWRKVVDSVHAAGARMAPQLWHVGAVDGGIEGFPGQHAESPSAEPMGTGKWTRAMTENDIADTIGAFASAALKAKAIGFDAIEVHGAHGYLIDQFFWHQTNRRTDSWGGGDILTRTRFAAEITRAIRIAIGPETPIIMRLSQWKLADYAARVVETATDMAAWLTPLAEAGVDIFHCSQRRFWEPEFAGSALNFAGWAKKLTGCTTIAVGSIGLSGAYDDAARKARSAANVNLLLAMMEREEFDLAALGRVLLVDPHWPERLRSGRYDGDLEFDPTVLQNLN